MKYNCNFDEFGNCALTRKRSGKSFLIPYKEKNGWPYYVKPGVGCCGNCGPKIGYFNDYPGSEDIKKYRKVKHLYLKVVGFWRPFGCILHDSEKSEICSKFRCCKEVEG